MIKDISSCTQ